MVFIYLTDLREIYIVGWSGACNKILCRPEKRLGFKSLRCQFRAKPETGVAQNHPPRRGRYPRRSLGSGREAEHAVLLIPFSWSIDQSSQSDAARQPALDRGLD
jgi:hypothetical protein